MLRKYLPLLLASFLGGALLGLTLLKVNFPALLPVSRPPSYSLFAPDSEKPPNDLSSWQAGGSTSSSAVNSTDLRLAIIEVFKKVSPAVVSVSSTRVAPAISIPFHDFELGPPDRVQGLGSGFFIRSDGYILTNNHVVEGSDDVSVTLPNRNSYPARVVGTSKELDIAILKIEVTDAPFLEFADSDSVQIGEWVVAIGNPLSLNYTVTQGIISGLERPGPTQDFRTELIQTDAAINQGNSGGPLVNLSGQVVGVNVAISVTELGKAEGIGFAIPAYAAQFAATQIIKSGRVEIGYIGVSLADLSQDQAESLGVPPSGGVFIARVEPGGPAEDAGMKSGDVITHFEGKPVRSAPELKRAVVTTPPGSTVTLRGIRDRKPISFHVKIGEFQKAREQRQKEEEARDWGFKVKSLTPEEAEALEISPAEGVIVTEVRPGTPASRARLEKGFVITRIGDFPIKTMSDFNREMEKHKNANRLVLRVKVRGNYENIIVLKR
ncbi:MAG: trypsin-like peptidase domain-containing protein [bacterium JZ-2024 1]